MGTGKPSKSSVEQTTRLMADILALVPRIYHRFSGIGDRLYGPYGLTVGKRALLRDLAHKGPHSINEMVRVRPPVTRQYIQRLVSELKTAGLVALSKNPDDRRSKIVELTPTGQKILKEIFPLEIALTQRCAASHSQRDLGAAGRVMQGVLDVLEDPTQWSEFPD